MAALSSRWDEALTLNQQIIATEPENVDALNRMARAYFELGDINLSKKFYQKSLKVDPYNQIAYKFLKRIETCTKKGAKPENHAMQSNPQLISDLFIEEPGRTKLVNLLKVAEPQKLSMLSAGCLVKLATKNRGISVTDLQGEYLGVIPDDLSHTLLRLIKGGNKYQALIKTIKPNGLTILIREIHRSSRFHNQPSFLDTIDTSLTYSSDHIVIQNEGYDPAVAELASDDEES